MKTALLFAGQGSQKAGMGKDLYEKYEAFRTTIDEISKLELGFDLKKTMFEDPDGILNQTEITQPCMAAFAAGVLAILKEKDLKADYLMGLSLGEYSALYAAGVFDLKTLMETVSFRGKRMQEASVGLECKMTAVLGLEREVVEKACEEISKEMPEERVSVTNYNCPSQYVITGTPKAVDLVSDLMMKSGAKKCMALKVSGPFHTEFMKPAGDALKEYFKGISFNEMSIPVIFNTTAKTLEESAKEGENVNISNLLEKQVQSSIYVEDSIKYLAAKGVGRTIEIGPGKAITGCVMRTDKSIETLRIEDVETLEKVLEKL